VLIDNPGFHLRLAEQFRMRGIPVYQYVAPKVWAWGQGRVEQLRRNFTAILGILPFEEEFFHRHQVNYHYVGSPLKDRIDKVIVRRESLGLPEATPVLACLPGSRPSELSLNLPTLVNVRQAVARQVPEAIFFVPIAANLPIEMVADILRTHCGVELKPRPVEASGHLRVESWEAAGLRFVRGMSLELMASADVAIVASGTATLECALLGTPMVVVYTMSELSYQIAKRVVKLPYVSLANLMLGRQVVQEYIQEFSISDVAAEVLSLLTDKERNREIRLLFEDMRDKLQGNAAQNAAALIASQIAPVGSPSRLAVGRL
jgi:lipid-A-disaccharide synthase